ncbi:MULTISPECIES: AraC family transcriptional regulator [Pectobacteriaceae]|nr:MULTISPECIES: AraC family transcriptional regulator [Pectobacteriaceae]MDX5628663.1 AraC family transcriptional regulator [Brenneria sp. L3-3Z]MDX5695802.1 AraC family transcriptional regulator [Brenneria sp. L4-2C]MEE3651931.1 AraC family transcriptional regulator [Brenneria sp. HEZEL_4_2_4]NPD01888.1 AraC family transcriptional regulator [Brenneria sp. hezel4-2-4]
MDPLSEVLSLLKLEAYISGGFPLTAGTGLEFRRHQGIKCYVVIDGNCWVAVTGSQEAIFLKSGDCVFLPSGAPFCLATAPDSLPQPFIPPDKETGSALTMQAPRDGAFILGGRFTFSSAHADILLHSLPPLIPVTEGIGQKVMRNAMECLREEMRVPQPGGDLIAQQLVQIMLVQALRVFLQQKGNEHVGWMFALSDPQLKAAITYMHQEPAFPWTLQELAKRVGMSRTVFTEHFKRKVGITPMKYLSQWRMLLAGERLRNSRDSITQISQSAGYNSDSAFGRAFKKEWGCSPREHRQQLLRAFTSHEQ